jgi:hypothetical protein
MKGVRKLVAGMTLLCGICLTLDDCYGGDTGPPPTVTCSYNAQYQRVCVTT